MKLLTVGCRKRSEDYLSLKRGIFGTGVDASEFKEQLRDSTDKNEKKDHKESFRFLKGCVLTVQEIAQKECYRSPTWLEISSQRRHAI